MNWRTNQQIANGFDLKLYALREQAFRLRDEGGPFSAKWAKVAYLLSDVRPAVRMMMSDEDRKATL